VSAGEKILAFSPFVFRG